MPCAVLDSLRQELGQRFKIFARPFTISSYWLTPQPQTQTAIWLIGESKMLAGTARRQEMPWSIKHGC
jgi:hypothetical protein